MNAIWLHRWILCDKIHVVLGNQKIDHGQYHTDYIKQTATYILKVNQTHQQ
jgi:hypothetical protein